MKYIFLLLLLLAPLAAQAKIYIVIDEASSRKFPIAVPQMLDEGGSSSALTQQVTALLKKDLGIAGIFKVLDEAHFVERDTDTQQIDFAKWTAIEAHALVKGMVTSSGGKSILEARLYDTQTQQLIVGKQYTFTKKDYAQVVHRFTDEVMKALTGIRGPFSSRVVASCGKANGRQIQTFSIDGAVQGAVTRLKANNISPNFSPDGGTIVFTSFIKYFPEIFSINADGTGLKQLTDFKATSITPTFSPNGETIVFASSKGGDTELYSMSRAGRSPQKITNILNIDVSPAFSPDGGNIVFASERAGNLHLFSMGAGGGGASRLTYTGYQNDQPDWSPDGRKIVFTARDRGAFDVFLMNPDGSMIQRLTRDEGNNESPTWSPDSRYVVFASGRAGGSGIYVMLADGNNQTLIPNTQGCINPDWGPWLQ